MKVAVASLVFLFSCSAFAVAPGTVSDVDDPSWSFVGKVNGASGVLVAPDLVLTAKHVGVGMASSFALPGIGTFSVTSVFNNPTSDLTLFRISTPQSNWARITTTDSYHKDVQMVGFGGSGVLNSGGTGYDINIGAGTRRAAPGYVEGYADVQFSASDPLFSFIVSPLRHNGQGALVGGDSGGGWFMLEDGQYRLVGTNSYIGRFYPGDTGITGNYQFSNSPDDFFGSGAVALIDYKDWLSSKGVELVPEPTTLVAIAIGSLLTLRSRRKRN